MSNVSTSLTLNKRNSVRVVLNSHLINILNRIRHISHIDSVEMQCKVLVINVQLLVLSNAHRMVYILIACKVYSYLYTIKRSNQWHLLFILHYTNSSGISHHRMVLVA